MKLVFRQAQEKDIKGLVDLCNECFLENTKYDVALQRFLEEKKDSKQIYLIGILNEEIVAAAKITIIPTIFDSMSKYAILNHVCVKESMRKHKIATHMLEVIEDICQARGCDSMKLWSRNFRVAAHACYKKFGFILDDAGFFYKEI